MTAPLAESLFMVSVMLLLGFFFICFSLPMSLLTCKNRYFRYKKQSTLYRTSVSYIFSTP